MDANGNPDRQPILDRLSRAEGQIRGIKRMIENERGCFEILKQVAAVAGALRSIQKAMLEHHVEQCPVQALDDEATRPRMIQELVKHLSEFRS